MDNKALATLGLQEKDFKPKEQTEPQNNQNTDDRLTELEQALTVLLTGVTDDE